MDWSPQLPATPVHLKQASEYSEYLICLKTGCVYLKDFFFGNFESHLQTKNAGFYFHSSRCVWAMLLLDDLSGLGFLMCKCPKCKIMFAKNQLCHRNFWKHY